jgi:short-subunit dehydrogenase
MLQRRRGHVVTIGALNGKHGAPFFATHSASKAALIAWTSGLRAELDGTGVSASIVCPGLVGGAGWWAERQLPVPWILGESSPAQVAAAVLRAIRHDHAEVLINPMPIRPALALHALGPALMSRLVDQLGLVDLVRRMIAP